MGYFSEKQIDIQEKYTDPSYHGFEDQLLWRYEDLKDRYLELLDIDAPASGDDCFTTDDYRYAPIHCFKTIRDVWRAMEIASAASSNLFTHTSRMASSSSYIPHRE